LTEAAVAAAARARLGANRAPRRVWFVDALPRNEAGKVVRSRLAALVGYVPPSVESVQEPDSRSPLEAAIAALWAAVLDLPHVAPDARFGDLGGDAAQASMLLDQVRDVFGVTLAPHSLEEATATPARRRRWRSTRRRSRRRRRSRYRRA